MRYVISIGGSVFAPKGIDYKYVSQFCQLIVSQITQGDQFYIVTGGGAICREYIKSFQQSMKQLNIHLTHKKNTLFCDYIGIAVTHVHAQLFRRIFEAMEVPEIKICPLTNTLKISNQYNIYFGCGIEPGHSTDYDAALFASVWKDAKILNLTNVDGVYNKNPKKSGAKKFSILTWKEYLSLFQNTTWESGMHAPFDLLASKYCAKHKLQVIVTNGRDLANVKNILQRKSKTKKQTLLLP